jgi:heparan-alpha-glucosaminide N-acetyltransferase
MPQNNRIASIDIFRALTMFLMIFVNDLWTIRDIPVWLEHTAASEDGMGLADVVFPAFLFIVGLSIPFAVESRRKKSETDTSILLHIGKRSLALIVMGFFMVNLENAASNSLLINENLWEILMAVSFIMIWNVYPSGKILGRIPSRVIEITGIMILLFLAVSYIGGTPGSLHWMRPHWWGILGLIGWAYLLCAVVYLYAGRNSLWIIIAWILLIALNIQEFALPASFHRIWIVVSASNHALVMSGVVASVLYLKLSHDNRKFLAGIFLLGLLMIILGFSLRQFWGISKILATPSWTTICAGISFGFFGLIYFIADVKGSTRWSWIFSPAGTNTLTCYLVPYFYYPLAGISGWHLPEFFITGFPGLVKSAAFSFLIIWITGLLGKLNVKLKV